MNHTDNQPKSHRHSAKTFVALSTFVMLTIPIASHASPQPQSPRPQNQELVDIAKTLLADYPKIALYSPTWNETRQISTSFETALKIHSAAKNTFAKISKNAVPIPQEQTEISIRKIELTDYLSSDSPELDTKLTAIEMKFSDPNSNRFTKISMWVQIENRWVCFPQPWVAFSEKLPPYLFANLFIEMLQREDYKDAYQFSAPAIRQAISQERFVRNFSSLGLSQATGFTWQRVSRETYNTESELTLDGEIEFQNGTYAVSKLKLVYIENEGYRPYQLGLTKKFGVPPSSALAPPRDKCKNAVRTVFSDLAEAIRTEDWAKFHKSSLSFRLKSATKPEDLKASFFKFLDTDFTFLANADITFFQPPSYDEEYGNSVNLDGIFLNASANKAMAFELNVSYSGKRWLINRIKFEPVRRFDATVAIPEPTFEQCRNLSLDTCSRYIKAISKDEYSLLHEQFAKSTKQTNPLDVLSKQLEPLRVHFQADGVFAKTANLEIAMRKPSVWKADVLRTYARISEPGGKWIQVDLSYLFEEGSWKLESFRFTY